ncbi:MAG: L-seryl-tRNA(Sec) selenium transferase, partial [Dehalococcoidia bacterium]
MADGFRGLPSVDLVLSQESIQELAQTYSHDAVVGLVRQQLEESRHAIADGGAPPTLADLADTVRRLATNSWHAWPQPVINATGVILHTNLGRAPLSAQAVQAVADAARGYTNLEFDLAEGKRGSRQAYVGSLLCQLTGAKAAFAVNNNASAVMLGLAAVAYGKEVIVSRGEAVEIGGGFRIPDVLAQSEARLVEVGTTNRTYVSDYERALTENTAALLKVHASNFRVLGFVHDVNTEELVELGGRYNLPVLHDLGSGCLLETSQFCLAHEPTAQESIAAGCGLAFFSGDKLLGGPQSGIVAGQEELVRRLERHPLARAVRLDKLGLAALSATLLHYLKDEATSAIP